MDRQTEITTPGALLNEKGDLARPGFSRALVQSLRSFSSLIRLIISSTTANSLSRSPWRITAIWDWTP